MDLTDEEDLKRVTESTGQCPPGGNQDEEKDPVSPDDTTTGNQHGGPHRDADCPREEGSAVSLEQPSCDDDKRPTSYNKSKGSGSDSKLADSTLSSCDVCGARESHSEHIVPSSSSEKHDKEPADKEPQKQREKDKDREGSKRKRDRGTEETKGKQCLKNAVGDVRGGALCKNLGKSDRHKCEIMGSDVKTTCRLECQIADTASNDTRPNGQPISETSHQGHQGSARNSDNSVKKNTRFGKRKGKRRKKSTESFTPVDQSHTSRSNKSENTSHDSLESSNGIDSSLAASHLDSPVLSETSEQTNLNAPIIKPTNVLLASHDASLNNPTDPNLAHESDPLTKTQASVSVTSDQSIESGDQISSPHESQNDHESTSEFMSLNKYAQEEEQLIFFTAKETSETTSIQSLESINELILDAERVRHGGGPQIEHSLTDHDVQPGVESEDDNMKVLVFKPTAVMISIDSDNTDVVENGQVFSCKERDEIVSESSQDGYGTEMLEGDHLDIISNPIDSIASEEHVSSVILDKILENESNEWEASHQDGLGKANQSVGTKGEKYETFVVLDSPADDVSSVEGGEIHHEANNGSRINMDNDFTAPNTTGVGCEVYGMQKHYADEDGEVQTIENGDNRHEEKVKYPVRGVAHEEEDDANIALLLQECLEEIDPKIIVCDEGGKENVGEGANLEHDSGEDGKQEFYQKTEQYKDNDTVCNTLSNKQPDPVEQGEKELLSEGIMGDCNIISTDGKPTAPEAFAVETRRESVPCHELQEHQGEHLAVVNKPDIEHEKEESTKHELEVEMENDALGLEERDEETRNENVLDIKQIGTGHETLQEEERGEICKGEEDKQQKRQISPGNEQTDDICRLEQKGHLPQENIKLKDNEDMPEEANRLNEEKGVDERQNANVDDKSYYGSVKTESVMQEEENDLTTSADQNAYAQPKYLTHPEEFNSYRPKAFDLESCTMSSQVANDEETNSQIGQSYGVPNLLEDGGDECLGVTVPKEANGSPETFSDASIVSNDTTKTIITDNQASAKDTQIDNGYVDDNEEARCVPNHEVMVGNITEGDILCLNPDAVCEKKDKKEINAQSGGGEFIQQSPSEPCRVGTDGMTKDTDSVLQDTHAESNDHILQREPCEDKDQVLQNDPCEDKDLDPQQEPCEDKDILLQQEPCVNKDLDPQQEPCEDKDLDLQQEPCENKDPVLQQEPCEAMDLDSRQTSGEDKDLVTQQEPCEDKNPVSQQEPCGNKDPVLQEAHSDDDYPIQQQEPCEDKHLVTQKGSSRNRNRLIQRAHCPETDDLQQQPHLFPTVIIQTNTPTDSALSGNEQGFARDISPLISQLEKVDQLHGKHQDRDIQQPQITLDDTIDSLRTTDHKTSHTTDSTTLIENGMPNVDDCYYPKTGVKQKKADKETASVLEFASNSASPAPSVQETIDEKETMPQNDKEPDLSTIPTSEPDGEKMINEEPLPQPDDAVYDSSRGGESILLHDAAERVAASICEELILTTPMETLELLDTERAEMVEKTDETDEEKECITITSLVEETEPPLLPQNEAPAEMVKKELNLSYVEEPGRSIDEHNWALVDEEGNKIDDRDQHTIDEDAHYYQELGLGNIHTLQDASVTKMESDESLRDGGSPSMSSWTVWKKKPLWRKVIARLKHPRLYRKTHKKPGKLSNQRTQTEKKAEATETCATDGQPRSPSEQAIGNNEDSTEDGWKTLDRDDSSLSVSKRGSTPNRASSYNWRRIRRLHRLRKGAEAVPDRLPPARRHAVTRHTQQSNAGQAHASRRHVDRDESPDQGGSTEKPRKRRTDLLLHGHIKGVDVSQVAPNSTPMFEVFCDKDRKEVVDLAGSLAAKETPTVRLLMKPLMTGMTAQTAKKASSEQAASTSGYPEGAGKLIDESNQIVTRPSKRFSCVVM